MMAAPVSFLRDGPPRPTTADMQRIAKLMYQNCGIALRPETKHAMVLARLQKRLRVGGFATFSDYLHYVESDRSGEELTTLIDALTTNHTSFYREPRHFDLLVQHLGPKLKAGLSAKPIVGWCAACATGEEAYTLAITLIDRMPAGSHDRIRLLASDLSTKALRAAKDGIYPMDRVANLPVETLHKHFDRGRGAQAGLVRVKRLTASPIEFRRLNLITIESLNTSFDFIFCRNVMIYFDGASRQRVVSMLEKHLAPGGHLFVSHSESLSEVNHTLRWCAPGVYQRGTP